MLKSEGLGNKGLVLEEQAWSCHKVANGQCSVESKDAKIG